ncbi:MAG: HAMP domain-containing histidine kinase [Sphingobium sp.]|jgi:signal transduction histidine kinase|uniref:sensor histidine kinase n=1 Tax=Sphingobium sp. TaxID=1912891 RepID=UPI0017C6D6C8|nr:HAMP domain-containing sensor histidine kinase [Sphingobium sp.]MBU0659198.1 HAMP domain-containing histidine kinase [Alphaproteobacteria bacterium]MBA4756549.1 HAMP domain-containing histidine kinase [Sphingobium sp.]MBU0774069.1 HAMP domain-containing histidine kinase [Alphaproteobacteria bacterium]MBU0869256.1 HAMP domain-containing histidine kinase [Alphaproteobacteria bacterium]MBU1793957.1 HAMP domain-containing histidine kinase [Alphaproteobacteria bacterium]
MDRAGNSKRGPTGPTLFRQIATRLAAFTLLFALLDVGIVVFTYSNQPESLAQELLTLEAERAERSTTLAPDLLAGPPGAEHWAARYIEPNAHDPITEASRTGAPAGLLMDWTRRERIPGGYRISGVRSVVQDGQQRWLFMQFEGDGIRPYVPVIANEIVQHVVLPLIPLSVLLLLFNIFAVRRVLQPLRRAEAEVDALDPDNVLLRLSEAPAPREVNTLVRAVNRALTRLDETMIILRGFTANAAHELRTPLSIMQLSLDRLPPSPLREDLQADTQHLTRLVSQMLDLAQADALAVEPGTTVDLADIGREIVAAMAPKVFDAQRDLRFNAVGDTRALGHAEAIYRIYRNLIDNALAHAPGDTPIEVTAGPGPQISVRDHGPGISHEDVPHIFERFWRKDRRKTDGAGLGLGIVQRLAQAHGGAITVENAQDGGALFRVTFAAP